MVISERNLLNSDDVLLCSFTFTYGLNSFIGTQIEKCFAKRSSLVDSDFQLGIGCKYRPLKSLAQTVVAHKLRFNSFESLFKCLKMCRRDFLKMFLIQIYIYIYNS
jgi:hypothetical protein